MRIRISAMTCLACAFRNSSRYRAYGDMVQSPLSVRQRWFPARCLTRPKFNLGPLGTINQVIKTLGKTIRAMAADEIDSQRASVSVTVLAFCGCRLRRQNLRILAND